VENTRASYAGPRTCKVKDTFLDTDLGDPGVDGRIILKWIFKKWDGGMDWIELAQDRDRCRAVVNTVMNLWVP
jgi:hypothetical protein